MSDVDPGERAWYAKPAFIAAAAVLVFVIVGGGVAIGVNQFRSDPAPTPSTSQPAGPSDSAEPTESEQPSADASVCGLEAGSADEPLSSAPATEWSYVGVTGFPASTEAGPGTIAGDGMRTCFAQSPEGALFAAGNITALGLSQSVSPEALEYFYAPGQNVPESTDWSDSNVQLAIVGFRMTTYDVERTTVSLALQSSTGELVSYVLDLTWADGDWKILLADDGSLLTPAAEINSLGGYVPWSAE